jgi:sarcosine oxidase subunit gamma
MLQENSVTGRLSALSRLPGSASASGSVFLTELRPGSILQVSAWPETLATVERAISELLGVHVPATGTAVADPDLTIAAVSRGRFVIWGAAPELAARFEAALPSSDGAVTNLSHGRSLLRLEGDSAELLARCLAIDLDPETFPPGRVAQTMIHHVDVLVHRHSRTVFVLCMPRSFAESLTHWLLDAGLELGTAVRAHGET